MKMTAKAGLFLVEVIVILFINYFPHYFAWKQTPSNFFFSGQASWFDPWDINNYLATIKVAQQGSGFWLANINTTAVVKPALVYPVHVMAGKLLAKINPVIVYQVLALAAAVLLIKVIFILSYLIFRKWYYALLAVALISLGGGFGYLFAFTKVSVDLTVPGVTMLSNFQKPHEAIASIFYFISLFSYYAAIKREKIIFLCLSIITLILSIPIYPYRLLSFYLIVGSYSLYLYFIKENVRPIIYGLISAITVFFPAVIYIYGFMTSGYSVLTSYSPTPISLPGLISGYGIFLLLFVYQLAFIRSNNPLKPFLGIWVIVTLILSVWPWGMGRLFLNSLIFPMAILLVLAIEDIAMKVRMPVWITATFILAFCLPTSVYVFGKRIAEVNNKNIWYYLPIDYKESFEIIEKQKGNGVLAMPPVNSFVPAFTGKHVYFGLPDQTPDYQYRMGQAVMFYSGKLSVEDARAFLQENKVNTVILSKETKNLGILDYGFLSKVYESDNLVVLSL